MKRFLSLILTVLMVIGLFSCSYQTNSSIGGETTGLTEPTDAVPDDTTVPPDESDTISEDTTAAPEETDAISDEITTAPEETDVISDETTTAPKEQDTTPEETTAAPIEPDTTPEETTAPQEETTEAPEETTEAPEETTEAPEETTEETTAAPEEPDITTEETTAAPEEPTEDSDDSNDDDSSNPDSEPADINLLRPDYDLGDCRNLSGNVSVVLFYMNDFESFWNKEDITNFTNNEIIPGLEFLEKEAKSYGVDLNLEIKHIYTSVYYPDEVILSVKQTGLATINVLQEAAESLYYSTDDEMIAAFKSEYGTEVICITIFNKNGSSYAINPPRGYSINPIEHCIIFAYDLDSDRNDPIGSQSSVVACNVLYLYGAESLHNSDGRKALAKTYYRADVMLSASYFIFFNNVGDATAFYVGWTNEVPDVLYDENW